MKLTFPLTPTLPDRLRSELAAALGIPAPYVDVYEDRLEVVGMVDESMRSTIEVVLAAHDPTVAVAPTLEERILEMEAKLDAAEALATKANATAQEVAVAIRDARPASDRS